MAGEIALPTYAREHVRLTVQPFDAPPRADQLQRIIEEIGSDEMLLFSTDYPHWHFDDKDALPDGLPEQPDAEDPGR